MLSKRLGCISFSGIVAAAVTLLVLAGVSLAKGGVLYSPGDLNDVEGAELGGVRTHAETGGECKACHAAPWSGEIMSDRCLACHSDLTQNPQDFHRVMLAQAEISACQDCHTDHQGAESRLTKMDLGDFPHNGVGFSLQGHRTVSLTCSDCHGETFTTFDQATCENCHAALDLEIMQLHGQAYGTDCLACHDGVDRYGKQFDHSQLSFPLEGGHSGLECVECHASARSADDLQGTPNECAACHLEDDPHQGSMGMDCGQCHTPLDWEQMTFDHAQTGFPLSGKHEVLPCEQCHTPERSVGGLGQTPTECVACHLQDDAHQGGLGTDCGQCHTPQDWMQASFDHALSAFPLEGAHAGLECGQCHLKDAEGTIFKGTPTSCYGCHLDDDPHEGRFGQDCQACHTVEGWLPASFDHSLSSFPLDGAHATVECSSCHVNDVYQGLSTQCNACHADPAYHQGLFSADCASCHNTSTWRSAQFNLAHGFPMGHGDANSCRDCHTNTLTTWTCYTCHNRGEMINKHSEEVGGNFEDCLRCHPGGQKEEGGGGEDD